MAGVGTSERQYRRRSHIAHVTKRAIFPVARLGFGILLAPLKNFFPEFHWHHPRWAQTDRRYAGLFSEMAAHLLGQPFGNPIRAARIGGVVVVNSGNSPALFGP